MPYLYKDLFLWSKIKYIFSYELEKLPPSLIEDNFTIKGEIADIIAREHVKWSRWWAPY